MKIRTFTAAALAGLVLAPMAAHAGDTAPDLFASERYSDVFDYSITWGSSYTLDATGMPADITFTDDGGGEGHFLGPVQVPAGVYDIDLSATTPSDVTYHKTLELTVVREKAVVRLASSNPTTVTRKKPFVVKARVKDQDDGSFGDITLADPGAFTLDRNGHITACVASVVPDSLYTGKGPDHYDVTCKVPSGLHRGTYELSYSVAGSYYAGSDASSLRITR
jgi:hypothetical protein